MPRGEKPYKSFAGDTKKAMETKGIKSKSKAKSYVREVRKSVRKYNHSTTPSAKAFNWPD